MTPTDLQATLDLPPVLEAAITVALEDPRPVVDYRLNAFGNQRWRCACGSRSCSGEIGGSFFALDPERQRRYLPYAPDFIRREYRRREMGTSAEGLHRT